MDLQEYAEALRQETLAAVEAEPHRSPLEHFTAQVAERLVAAGEFNDTQVAFYKATGMEISGWSLDDDERTLHLFVTDHRLIVPPASLTPTQVNQAFRRLSGFFAKSLDGYATRLEESSAVFEIADLIGRQGEKLESLRLYLFSDAVARAPEVPDAAISGIPVSHHVWDFERLYRFDTSGLEREPIVVDVVKRWGQPIPCLPGLVAEDHTVYLLLIPGHLLADLYAQYGARLLERNVRSFLQARGAVNKGIRATILNEPGRFLAYNNGISATAADLRLVSLPDGGFGIAELRDLQIVNGGQTTASIHAALAKDRADLSGLTVQAKLTVVAPECLDEMVPNISRCSNTQNKVTGADFSANHPFHVRLEELSRSVWAPAPDGTQRQTRWFYERARGQYADELGRARTPAKQRQFKLTSPANQKFTKTDLAKFEHSWEQLPHLVSLGAEKNFREFMLRLEERKPAPPEVSQFERSVAKAILFRTAEKVVSAQKLGGYRANIVTYSIAKLAHATAHRLDLDRIWKTQKLSDATVAALVELSHMVHEVIVNPSGRVQHIGEWCKKLDCWKAVEELSWQLPAGLEPELIPLRRGLAESLPVDKGIATLTSTEEKLISEVAEIGAEDWFRLSNWAKETNSLQSWQRSLAFSLGRLAGQGAPPSIKQATQGEKIWKEAGRRGFK